jgi:NADPH:quinone reductase
VAEPRTAPDSGAMAADPPTMRAVRYTRQGPAADVLELVGLPVPEPGPGEVRVRVHASAVNPSDTRSRSGARGPLDFPVVVPHNDGAGVVVAVGDGVARDRVGERVWLYQAQWGRPHGTAAEFVVVPSERAVPLPAGTTFEEGACLGVPALTAHACVHAAGSPAGRTVLVSGGAGRVGRYAVQLAKAAGARVVATAGDDGGRASAAEAGADVVLPSREPGLAGAVREASGGRGVDLVVEVDLGANLPLAREVLAEHGTVAAYASRADPTPVLDVYPLMYRSATLCLILVYSMREEAKAAAVHDLTGLMDAGALSHRIGGTWPLERTGAAHEAVETGRVRGSAVVTVR